MDEIKEHQPVGYTIPNQLTEFNPGLDLFSNEEYKGVVIGSTGTDSSCFYHSAMRAIMPDFQIPEQLAQIIAQAGGVPATAGNPDKNYQDDQIEFTRNLRIDLGNWFTSNSIFQASEFKSDNNISYWINTNPELLEVIFQNSLLSATNILYPPVTDVDALPVEKIYINSNEDTTTMTRQFPVYVIETLMEGTDEDKEQLYQFIETYCVWSDGVPITRDEFENKIVEETRPPGKLIPAVSSAANKTHITIRQLRNIKGEIYKRAVQITETPEEGEAKANSYFYMIDSYFNNRDTWNLAESITQLELLVRTELWDFGDSRNSFFGQFEGTIRPRETEREYNIRIANANQQRANYVTSIRRTAEGDNPVPLKVTSRYPTLSDFTNVVKQYVEWKVILRDFIKTHILDRRYSTFGKHSIRDDIRPFFLRYEGDIDQVKDFILKSINPQTEQLFTEQQYDILMNTDPRRHLNVAGESLVQNEQDLNTPLNINYWMMGCGVNIVRTSVLESLKITMEKTISAISYRSRGENSDAADSNMLPLFVHIFNVDMFICNVFKDHINVLHRYPAENTSNLCMVINIHGGKDGGHFETVGLIEQNSIKTLFESNHPFITALEGFLKEKSKPKVTTQNIYNRSNAGMRVKEQRLRQSVGQRQARYSRLSEREKTQLAIDLSILEDVQKRLNITPTEFKEEVAHAPHEFKQAYSAPVNLPSVSTSDIRIREIMRDVGVDYQTAKEFYQMQYQ